MTHDGLDMRTSLLHAHRVGLGSIEEVLCLIMVCSWFHVLGKPLRNAGVEVIVGTTSNILENSIPMAATISTKTLSKILKLEGTSRKREACSNGGIEELHHNA